MTGPPAPVRSLRHPGTVRWSSERGASLEKERVFDSPKGWVASHIRDYVESDGRRGHRWHGVDTLLLTTRGRRSGKLRRTALIYGRDGDRYVVVASTGGGEHHPAWYLNLVDDPEVSVQVGPDRFTARARTATPAERAGRWKEMALDLARLRPVPDEDGSRDPGRDPGARRRGIYVVTRYRR